MLKKEYIIVPALLALLFIQFTPYQLTKALGEDAVLNAELYDPRDVFRGDYVALNFTQETVADSIFDVGGKDLWNLYDRKLYAQLNVADGIWTVTKVSDTKPAEGIYIKCRLDYYEEFKNTAVLDFGIDRFYVEENTGTAVETAAREGRLKLKVKIWNGNMVLADTLITQ